MLAIETITGISTRSVTEAPAATPRTGTVCVLLAGTWRTLYPPDGLDPSYRDDLERLVAILPSFVGTLLGHRPVTLRGRRLGDALRLPGRDPAR